MNNLNSNQHMNNNRRQNPYRYQNRHMGMMPFGIGPMNPFNVFNQMEALFNMPNDIQCMMQNMSNIPTNQGFSHSSVMTFSSNGNSQPYVYQESQSTRIGPGGVKEVRKTIKDSKTGREKVLVGHHIGERAHVIQKNKNINTGEEEEEEEFINIDEAEAIGFNQEWAKKTKNPTKINLIDNTSPQLALTYNSNSASTSHPTQNQKPVNNGGRSKRHRQNQ
ncbi:myeloid leukemia factor 1-like [Gordionus sp. m RMFG-2023]|uniref:myeloid leukemia factor 1-like n=1 Tax=Gordionus sp. m RMFG-2023 TaxID=3053472 RepID=UPI0031FE24E4